MSDGTRLAAGPRRRGRVDAAILATVLVACTPDIGWPWPETPAPVLDTSACDPDSRTRLGWLVDRLEARERYADLWWRGWIGFYGLGAIVEGVRAGIEDDDGKRADQVVSAVKAVGGVTRLYFTRPVARLGADPLRGPLPDAAACRARVAQGEDLLRQAAKQSERRWDWKAHFFNVAVNVAGGVIVAEGFDYDDGWISAGVGVAVGEVMLWSFPWKAPTDLEEYEARFTPSARAPLTWAMLPYQRGLRLQVRF